MTIKRSANLTLLALAAIGLYSCDLYEDYQRLTKQLPTFANMQMAAEAIDKFIEKSGSIDGGESRQILSTWNNGRDEWGNEFIFHARYKPSFSYLLVSTGSDRRLDVEDIDQYFELEKTDIVGQFHRDIVFRDGECITIASAK